MTDVSVTMPDAKPQEDFGALARQLFGNIRQKFLQGDRSGAVHMSSVPVGDCQLTMINAPAPHVVIATKAVQSSFDPDSIKVLVQKSGVSRFHHNGQRFKLGPNAAVIYDPTFQYSLVNYTPVDQVVLQLPRHLLDDRQLRRIAAPIFMPGHGSEFSNTLASFISTSSTTVMQLPPALRSSLGESLATFAQGIIGEAFRSDMVASLQSGSLMLLRERAKAYVAKHLQDPDLTVEAIAQRMGCSTRYLHKAFESECTTLHRYIWDRRLEYSHSQILSDRGGTMTISEIAFRSGFNSSPHFSRAFKQRYALTPNEVRAGLAQAQPVAR
ncbi:helix-turn-helix domain-containing protein [Cognatishimia sp. SS12]|uniref:helix-turn-helix domain-containing protein n=1 Tax=Cognatishimia sp. SS12 TaxID=2979465 RepID=UPI00232EAECD|nr:helix-turn-helix domain-containing protein [Cognatishimia sp. SS12]MDC0739338.1 helix-turn-helix domain-containing protein [Cognatishimia sp. SS12]